MLVLPGCIFVQTCCRLQKRSFNMLITKIDGYMDGSFFLRQHSGNIPLTIAQSATKVFGFSALMLRQVTRVLPGDSLSSNHLLPVCSCARRKASKTRPPGEIPMMSDGINQKLLYWGWYGINQGNPSYPPPKATPPRNKGLIRPY